MKQYVALKSYLKNISHALILGIAAGGGGKNKTPSGDAYIAFALPQNTNKEQ